MDISNSQYTHKAHSVSAPHFRGTALKSLPEAGQTTQTTLRDEVNLSAEAQKLSETAPTESTSSAAPRLDLINRIRSEILAGTYETPEKLDAALDKMLESLS